MPAEAGIQEKGGDMALDSRLRGNDKPAGGELGRHALL